MSIMFGNQTPEQIEKRLCIILSDEHKEELRKTWQHKAENIEKGMWHCFDMPFMLVCGDAETAKNAAIAELSQAHSAEITEIREKLDVRTEDLMQARKEVGDMQILLQKEQTKTADLERQLNAALAEVASLKDKGNR